ncbi:hypothetical protein B0A48_13221 [Cryoendolithus antarcticus]|uniref:Piwi domain-containing protein n=1 Tax=Cryoendolithus antarcticus TaxID=1507870 RepID=A0A1V8SNU2_9PEZI|nr:hypothetical protein B0A48_13221 [Cryoendolithus antarcticus]
MSSGRSGDGKRPLGNQPKGVPNNPNNTVGKASVASGSGSVRGPSSTPAATAARGPAPTWGSSPPQGALAALTLNSKITTRADSSAPTPQSAPSIASSALPVTAAGGPGDSGSTSRSTPTNVLSAAGVAVQDVSTSGPLETRAVATSNASHNPETNPDAAAKHQNPVKFVEASMSLLKDEAPTYAALPKQSQPIRHAIPLKVRANMFGISTPKTDMYVYAFGFASMHSRELRNRKIKKELIVEVLRQPPFTTAMLQHVATDYTTMLVSLVDLSQHDNLLAANSARVFTVPWTPQGSTTAQSVDVQVRHKHTISHTAIVRYLEGTSGGNINIAPHLAALNILLRKIVTGPDAWTVLGLESRHGFLISSQAFHNNLAVNTLKVATAFITAQPLVDYVGKRVGIQRLVANATTQTLRAIRQATHGLQVRYVYTPPARDVRPIVKSSRLTNPAVHGRLKRINGMGTSAHTQFSWHDDSNAEITVQHFFEHYVINFTLTRPELPVMNLGSLDRPVYVPMELLYVEPHQPLRGMLDRDAMTEMTKVAQHTPMELLTRTEAAFAPGGMFDLSYTMRTLGIAVQPHMTVCSALMLPLPNLLYGGGRPETSHAFKSRQGDGRWDIQKRVMHKAVHIPWLGIIEIGQKSTDPQQENYAALVVDMQKYGIHMDVVPNELGFDGFEIRNAANSSKAALKVAWNGFSETVQDTRFAIVLMRSRDKDVDEHAAIKRWGELDEGVSTMCLTRNKFQRNLGQPAFRCNLVIKINAKLNGQNHVLDDISTNALHALSTGNAGGATNTMIVGADVTHPGSGAIAHCPSIAAVVASVDRELVNFPGSMRVQKSKQEMIQDLEVMMLQRLQAFYFTNKRLPANILFYRDGVSDSQFRMVKLQELPQIERACVTAGVRANIPNYTPKITLVLREPSHYFVIHNGMDLSAAQLQQHTFALCWIYASSLTPISYVAPAYYADRMCERGRKYLHELLKPGQNSGYDDRSLVQGWNGGLFQPPNQAQGWEYQLDQMKDKDAYAVRQIMANRVLPRLE